MNRISLTRVVCGILLLSIQSIVYCSKPKIEFSTERGFYYSGFELTIFSNITECTIKYTLDGSDPRNSSNSQTSLSSAKIPVSPFINEGRAITPGVVIRACAITNTDTSEVETHTYIFPLEIKFQSDVSEALAPYWPDQTNIPHIDPPNLVDWMRSNDQLIDLGVDPEIVSKEEYFSVFEGAMLDIPALSLVTAPDNLFDESSGIYVNATWSGMDWERPGSIELINSSSEGFQSNTGIRIRGGWSCRGDFPKHAFRLFFRMEYGNGKLDYPLFEDQGVTQFDKIDLRCNQNNSWSMTQANLNADYVHEPFARDIQGDMHQPFTRSRFYHLFLNGMYWGLYETQERPEASFAASYLGGNREDYDVVKSSGPSYDYPQYTVEATDGNTDSYYKLWQIAKEGFSPVNYNKALGLNTDGTPNPAYKKFLDEDNLIDYMIIFYFSANTDGPGGFNGDNRINNFFGIYNNVNPDGFKFILHDAESAFSVDQVDVTNLVNTAGEEFSGFNPAWLHQRLMENTEYRQKFADRAYKYLYNDGVLSVDKIITRFEARVNQIDQAIIGESARWGDLHAGTPMTRDNNWEPVIKRYINTYFPQRTAGVINQFKVKGWLNNIESPVFDANDFIIDEIGTRINKGETFKLTNPNTSGVIYYTLNNSDPRKTGGSISEDAIQYTSEIKAVNTIFIKARIKDGNKWSPLAEKVINIVTGYDLKITEINYNPKQQISGSDTLISKDLEFIELKNCYTDSADVSGFEFIKGIQYRFPRNSIIFPDSIVVIASDSTSFKRLYGFSPYGQFEGSLKNEGDEINLIMNSGNELLSFIYNDGKIWFDATDGSGFTLVFRDNSHNQYIGLKDDWRVSTNWLGSPGKDDPAAGNDSITITEVLANTDKPLTDAIELFNTSGMDISIGNWFLSDEQDNPDKWAIPNGTIIPSHGYLVFYEGHYLNDTMKYHANEFGSAFSISSAGESIYLFSANSEGNINNFVCAYTIGATDNNTSFGNYINSADEINQVQLDSIYLGLGNVKFKVSPVIFKTIMYHPAGNNYEYIMLKNRSDSIVNLYFESDSSITWGIDGIKFEFPAKISVGVGDSLYIVEKRIPAEVFKSVMNIDPGIQVFNFRGQLKNSSEILSIMKPISVKNDSGMSYAYVNMEKVEYKDKSPWPAIADGDGYALQRKNEEGFANDVTNWTTIYNIIPDANAGLDKRVRVNVKTSLDGSGSNDPAGVPISYRWKLISKPENSNIQLSDSSSVKPEITPDKVGNYNLSLQVDNDEAKSAPSFMNIYAYLNRAPFAWGTGYNMTAYVNKAAVLNGARSYDPDFEEIFYWWEIIARPEGSITEIGSPSSEIASFTPDLTGRYTIRLTVNDGELDSDPFNIKFTVFRKTDIIDNTITDNILIYPNPVHSLLNVEYDLINTTDLLLSLTDVNGREVYSRKYTNLLSGIQKFTLDMKEFNIQSGIYFLYIQSDEFLINKKIIYMNPD